MTQSGFNRNTPPSQLILFANITCALAISTSDMASTWWFMSPLEKIGIDPAKYEAGPTLRWLVKKVGVRIGLLMNGIAETLAMTVLLSFVVFASPYFFKGVDLILSAFFWYSLAATYFALIVRSNYRFGKSSRASLKVSQSV